METNSPKGFPLNYEFRNAPHQRFLSHIYTGGPVQIGEGFDGTFLATAPSGPDTKSPQSTYEDRGATSSYSNA